MRAPFQILFEDNHLLAVVKPAMLPTMGTAPDRPSLLTIAKRYVKQRYQKPGNVYLGVVSRLDAPVSGVVVFARTSKSAKRLNEQFRSGAVRKIYWAIVSGFPKPAVGRCVDWLRKGDQARRTLVVDAASEHAKEARLSYRTLSRLGDNTLLEVDLETGRKHQIRVQLARRGHPVLGDRKYGSRVPFPGGIALHARQLALVHPVRKTPIRLVAQTPGIWKKYGVVEP